MPPQVRLGARTLNKQRTHTHTHSNRDPLAFAQVVKARTDVYMDEHNLTSFSELKWDNHALYKDTTRATHRDAVLSHTMHLPSAHC